MVYKLLKTISSHPRVKPQPHAGKIVLKTTTTTTATTKRSKAIALPLLRLAED